MGEQRLAEYVRVSRGAVQDWLAGTMAPHPRAFFLMLGMLEKVDPTYRPLRANWADWI